MGRRIFILAVMGVCIMASGVSPARAAPIEWAASAGGNGHYYEYQPDLGITWTQANATAQLRSYLGVQGHLTTITSEQENDFLVANFSNSFARSVWLGGWQEEGMAPAEGWHWVTGEPWGYTRWIAGDLTTPVATNDTWPSVDTTAPTFAAGNGTTTATTPTRRTSSATSWNTPSLNRRPS